MNLNDLIAEVFGSYANMMEKNKSNPLSVDDVLLIFRTAQIENTRGSNEIAPAGIKALAEYAVKYWKEKDKPNVVANIERYFATVFLIQTSNG